MLELISLSKKYGNFKAVNNLNLVVKEGEFFSLLGPSGCGKTTTLRLIAGFEQPTSGKIQLNEKDITELPPFQRNINTVFQHFALFPHLSAFNNIAFGLRIKKKKENEIKQQVTEMLKFVSLEGKSDSLPNQLSGGQQQRVALARALINQPSILLLDEPLGALDEKLRDQMQVELSNLQKKVGITFIFVTHNQEEALTMADRIAVMKDGTIDHLGTPDEIYLKPSSTFTASFIGNTNLFKCVIETKTENSLMLRTENNFVFEKFDASGDNIVGKNLTISLRPEQIRLSRNNPHKNENGLKGIIKNEVFYGDMSIFWVTVLENIRVAVSMQNYVASENVSKPFQEGEEVFICWDKKSGHLITE